MTIREVSNKFGVAAGTLRYYEREGLIPPVPKNSSGAREYDSAICKWIEIVICFRNAGVGIDTLKKYVQYLKTNKYKDEGKVLLQQERDGLLQKLSDIHKSLEYLNYIIDNYENGVSILEKDYL